MTEKWLPIPEYEGYYSVSNQGQVRSVDRVTTAGSRWRGRVLKSAPDKDGHLRVVLSRGNKQKNFFVHYLVMLAFVGSRPSFDVDICHFDGDPTNNYLENLRYDTKTANRKDDVRHGKVEQVFRTHCPRGHELSDWNNVGYYKNIGRRTCRACGNARSYARRHGIEFDPEIADQYHEKLRMEYVHGQPSKCD